MGSITSTNQIQFQSCKSLFAQIRLDLKSFDALGLIDDRTMYRFVGEIISDLGLGYYMEKQAVVPVSRYKTKLPEDFHLLYSAYKCKSDSVPKGRVQPQTGAVFFIENTCEKIAHCKCDIEKVVDKVTVRTYLDEGQLIYNFSNPTLLRLVTTTNHQFCTPDSPNLFHTSSDEISIDNGNIHTNFEDGNIYLKYYGFPFDERGLPMIPDDKELKLAVSYYIKFRLLEGWWLNSEVPDVERRMAKMEQQYLSALSNVNTKMKTPSFQTMLEYKNRTADRFDIFQFYN